MFLGKLAITGERLVRGLRSRFVLLRRRDGLFFLKPRWLHPSISVVGGRYQNLEEAQGLG
jgi:hypothetical protein